jgi:hypothetical protein
MQRAGRGLVPQANPFYTPLGPNPVYTLAASFIKSCPASNAPLPFKAFPALKLVTGGNTLAMGMPIMFSIPSGDASGCYVTFVSGLSIVSVEVEGSGMEFMATIPMGVEGQSYAFLTSKNVTGGPGSLMDADITNGPAIVEVTPNAPTYDNSIL